MMFPRAVIVVTMSDGLSCNQPLPQPPQLQVWELQGLMMNGGLYLGLWYWGNTLRWEEHNHVSSAGRTTHWEFRQSPHVSLTCSSLQQRNPSPRSQ